MEETLSKFVTAIVAIFILFIFPVYIAYEKKDDISYALAVRYTQDFVDKVRSKGYITKDLYADYLGNLARTGNSYDVELEHRYVRYDGNEPALADEADPDSATIITSTRNEEIFTTDYIVNVLNRKIADDEKEPIYQMNVNDTFNVKIKNTNVTLATVIYNLVTVNMSKSNVRIFVDYGGKILAEKWYSDDLVYAYNGYVEIEDIIDDDVEDEDPVGGEDDFVPDYGGEDTPTDNTGEIIGAGAGDLNGDNSINTKDSVTLAQYIAGWNVEIVEANADLNCDGKIDTKDSVTLAQYIAGWNVKIGCDDKEVAGNVEETNYYFSSNFEETPLIVEENYLTTSKPLYGDVYDDGKINSKDVVAIAQFLAGWDVKINKKNADVHCDGNINSKDVVLLAQYLAGWDVEIGCKDTVVEEVDYIVFGDLDIEGTLITVQYYNKMLREVKASSEYKKYLNGQITPNTFYDYLDKKYVALNEKNSYNIVKGDIQILSSYIDMMSNVEVLARLASAEQGGNSFESQVLVALSVLNRAAEKAETRTNIEKVFSKIKEVAKSNGVSKKLADNARTYSYSTVGSGIGSASIECTCTVNKGSNNAKQCKDGVRKLITYEPKLGHFWDKPSQESIDAAREAMKIFQYQKTYYVSGVNCINVYGFQSSDYKSDITSNWNNWKRLFINNNRVGNDYTGFYKNPSLKTNASE